MPWNYWLRKVYSISDLQISANYSVRTFYKRYFNWLKIYKQVEEKGREREGQRKKHGMQGLLSTTSDGFPTPQNNLTAWRKKTRLDYKRRVFLAELPQTHDPWGREKVVWSLFLPKLQDVQTTFYQACTIMEALPKSTNCSQKREMNMYEHYQKPDNSSKILSTTFKSNRR